MFEGKEVKVLLAQAGSGKTARLIEEVTKELETRRPEEIAFVTFTRKGAHEGLFRVCNKLMYEPDDLPYFRTLHSLTFHALGLKASQMFGRIEQRKFNKEYGYTLNRSETNTGKVHASKDTQYLDFYDMERSGALTTKQLVEADIEMSYYRQLIKNYEEYKAKTQTVDFFDCLINYVKEGVSLPVKVAMIDECFSPDTKVRMADLSIKAIKDIKVGEYVMGTKGAVKVIKTCKGKDTMYDVKSIKGDLIFTCNSKHLIQQYTGYNTTDEWRHAEALCNDHSGVYVNRIHYATKQKAKWGLVSVVPCCNKGKYVGITVDADDHLFLLANGAVVHNCQDITFLQWKVIEKAFSKAEKIIIAGDENQCQPTGSKVLTDKGYKNIEDITNQDNLITFDRQTDTYHGYGDDKYHAQVAVNYYEGDLIKIVYNDGEKDIVNYFTPNHKMIVHDLDKRLFRLCFAGELNTQRMLLPYALPNHKCLYHKVEATRVKYKGNVYSMNVDKYHTYVTSGGLTVHNSIYQYSGARPDFLIELANKYPVEHLSVSYRIPQQVYFLAKAIVGFIGDKTDKPFNPRMENEQGNITQLTGIDRLRNFIKDNVTSTDRKETPWYILARNNCFLSRATEMLEDNLIPYWTADGFFMGGEIMKRLKEYERFSLKGYKDDSKKESFQRKFGIEDFTQHFTETNLFVEERKWVYASYIEKYGLETLEKMCKWNPQILVSTIHHVKGGEAENVAIMLDTTRKTKGNVFNNIDEELRILYVAVTRAKKNLYLIDSKNGEGYNNIIDVIKEENNLVW